MFFFKRNYKWMANAFFSKYAINCGCLFIGAKNISAA